MRQLNFLALLLFIFSSFSMLEIKKERHIGKWKGLHNDSTVEIWIFDTTNHASFISHGQLVDGHGFEMDHVKIECKYEIDYNKNPAWLDLVYIGLKNNKQKDFARLPCIFRFISDDKMEIRIHKSGERFEKFDLADKETDIIFERVKE